MNNKKEVIRMIKFMLFSISAGVIEGIVFAILNELTNLEYWPCYLSALILSVLWNFTLNRKFTFKAANNIPLAMLKVALFYVVFTLVFSCFYCFLLVLSLFFQISYWKIVFYRL